MNIADVLKELGEIKMKMADIEKRLTDLENSSKSTGVYLDGCPEYVSEYIKNNSKDKEGV